MVQSRQPQNWTHLPLIIKDLINDWIFNFKHNNTNNLNTINDMITIDDLKFKRQFHGGIGAVLKTKSKVTISIQAGESLYSVPRENDLELYSYTAFEVALLNTKGEFITKQFLDTGGEEVAGWVSRDVIDTLIYQLDR
jgi:hypothetical protein